jgi:DNA-binding transcriptional LysR family regulator
MSFNLDAIKGLSIERLQTLCLVAEKGGITKAAQSNPNRQSLFSRQIKELETALGVVLINRGQTPRCLTAEGERLERAAREFLRQLCDLSSSASDRRIEITVGAGESVIQWLLIPRLKALFSTQEICLTFRNLPSRGIVDQLLSQRLDLGVVRKSALRGSLASRGLGTLGMKAAVSKRQLSSMAKKKSLSWKEIIAHPWVILEGDGDFRSAVLEQAEAQGLQPDVAAQCTSYGQVIDALRTAPLIGFLPDYLFPSVPEDIVPLAFEAVAALKRDMVIARHPTVLKTRPEVAGVIEEIIGRRNWK